MTNKRLKIIIRKVLYLLLMSQPSGVKIFHDKSDQLILVICSLAQRVCQWFRIIQNSILIVSDLEGSSILSLAYQQQIASKPSSGSSSYQKVSKSGEDSHPYLNENNDKTSKIELKLETNVLNRDDLLDEVQGIFLNNNVK